ncbi:MAG: hypothetical protein LIO62_06230 [Clostridiales bacterium]|nr:hypothetical protein [Clostridiales bacterium]
MPKESKKQDNQEKKNKKNNKSNKKNNKKSNKKKGEFSLRKLIYNDKYLIIISIVAAVVIWIATSMNLSPETTKTITVPLTVDFTDSAAEQLGMKCYGDETVDVDVVISCKKYLAKDITADDINVSLQTNAVTSKGSNEVPITVDVGDSSDYTVSSYYPTTYKAYFDVEDQKTMDIEIQYDKEDFIADGYVMGKALLSETTVTVTGPKTYVSQVSKVVSTVSVDENLNKTQSYDATLTALDSNGSSVDYITLDTGSDSLSVTIPVLKEMQLDVTSEFTGKPSGISTDDWTVTYSQNTVNAGVLEDAELTSANLGNIDFSSLQPGKNKFEFDLSTLDSIVVLDSIDTITATVTVPSTYETSNISTDNVVVNVTNVPEGYSANVVEFDSSSIIAVGESDDLEEIESSNIAVVVDLSAYENSISVGTSNYTASVTIENSDTCWVYGIYTATIEITED